MHSHSSIGTYEQCPARYQFRYVQKLRTDTESIESYLGKRVHEALERLYKLARGGRLLTEDELLDGYEAEWDRNWSADVQVVNPDLKPEHYRSVGRKCLADYYRHYHPFDQHIVVDTERRIVVPLDPEGRHKLLGFVDRIDKISDGVIEIHDYKTNASLPTQQEKDADRQLALYEIGLRETLADIRDVHLVWHYLRFDQEIRSQRTPDELEQLRTAMVGKIQQIEAATTAGDFPTVVSGLCDWCEFKPICPAWKHHYQTYELKPAEYKAEHGVALVNRLATVTAERRDSNKLYDALTVEIEGLEEAIIQYAKQHGVERIFGSDREAAVSHERVWAIPAKSDQPKLYEALVSSVRQTALWSQLSELSRKKLQDFLGSPDGKELRERLAGLVTQQDDWSVSLRKRKTED